MPTFCYKLSASQVDRILGGDPERLRRFLKLLNGSRLDEIEEEGEP
jgi:hypothetical protein